MVELNRLISLMRLEARVFLMIESIDISNEIRSRSITDDFVLKKIIEVHFELKSLCLRRTKITD